jgi:hypothetical protein
MLREEIEVGDDTAFNFLPPYDSILSNKTYFVVKSVSLLQSLVDKGLNPKENIYKLYTIESDYDADIASNVHIAELSIGSKDYYVPLNKIVSKNNIPQVAYSERMIGIKLGFIPDAEDLTSVLADIDLFIKNRLGIVAKIGDAIVTGKVVISEPEHLAFNTTRNGLKTENGNYMKLYYDLQVKQQELITKLQSLETAYLNGAMV